MKSQPKTISLIWISPTFDDPVIFRLTKKHRIPLQKKSDKEVGRFVPGKKYQGIVAKVSSFLYTAPDKIFEKKLRPTGIILDRIQDPQNVGNILRTLACFGDSVLCLTKNASCSVTDSVVHVASGGENYVSVTLVSNLVSFLDKLKNRGYCLVGSSAREGDSLYTHSFAFPLAILLGSEGTGLRAGLKKHLDFFVHIPMRGAQLSFNVSQAMSIFAYEIAKQKGAMES